MTAARQSQVFALEKEFGKGRPADASWIAVPPGSFMQFTLQRATTRINTTGSKFFDSIAYGQLRGRWDWNFVLDYNYLEPLLLVFDKYRCKRFKRTKETVESGVIVPPGEWVEIGMNDLLGENEEDCYEHYFTKRNGNRVPSFAVREVILHGVAGNTDEYPDEIRFIKGCVCESIRFSQSAGNSQMTVTMSGFYVSEEMHRVALNATDYTDYDNTDGLIEYFCLFLDKFLDPYYVANTESLGIDVNLSTAPIANTCCPFSQQFYEGYTTFQFSTSCWANDPKRYKERMYRGGKTANVKIKDSESEDWMNYNDNVLAERTDDYTNHGADPYTKKTNLSDLTTLAKPDGYMFTPACKGLAPMEHAWMVSYNLCREELTEEDMENDSRSPYYKGVGHHSLTKAIDRSDKMVKIHITKCVVNSATWQKGDGSKLYDQLSSTECRLIDFTVRNHTPIMAEVTATGTAREFLNHTLIVAGEKAVVYTITLKFNDGATPDRKITQDYNTAIVQPDDPTRTGYTFQGWVPAIPAVMPQQNITCIASWTINSYTITLRRNNGTADEDITQNYGTPIVAPENPTRDGYVFEGWNPPIPTTMPAENMVCIAQWSSD